MNAGVYNNLFLYFTNTFISLYQDGSQTHQLSLQCFLYLQMHPMNSTLAGHGQNLKHMASQLTSERNFFSGFIILYLNHRCIISVYFIQFSMCNFNLY